MRYKDLHRKIFGYPLVHKSPNIAPFFIIGSGRSGNTLLRRILFAHTDIFIPEEIYTFANTYYIYQKLKRNTWPTIVYSVLSEIENHPEFSIRNDSLEELASCLITIDESDRSFATILDQFYRFLAKRENISCRVWGDKTPVNTYNLPLIQKTFPTAKYIHLIRDGIDVAHSYYTIKGYNSLDKAAIRWKTAVEQCQSFGSQVKEQFHEVRYENLVGEPELVIGDICNFLEISFDVEMINDLNSVSQMRDVESLSHHENVKKQLFNSSVGKGRRAINNEEGQLLNKLIGKQLKKLDYPLY